MTHSMTAFSRVQNQIGPSLLCWELKSVNHRYLDVTFRLPEPFRFLEANLRNMLRGQISRGKLECQLRFTDMMDENQSMLVNEGLVHALLQAGTKIAIDHHIANDFTVSHVLNWPGVLQVTPPNLEALAEQALQLFKEAVTTLQAARLMEGNELKEHVRSRLLNLRNEIQLASEHVSSSGPQTREKLLARLHNLQLNATNEARIEQEIALLLARLDVTEELDRLQVHINEVERTLNTNDAVGRGLDFLMQELNREANTLSSKSDSAVLTQHAVQMKILIEQMREQIQNIE